MTNLITNLTATVMLLVTNPVPDVEFHPSMTEQILSRQVSRRFITPLTNDGHALLVTNDVALFKEKRRLAQRWIETDVWIELPVPRSPLDAVPATPLPQNPRFSVPVSPPLPQNR